VTTEKKKDKNYTFSKGQKRKKKQAPAPGQINNLRKGKAAKIFAEGGEMKRKRLRKAKNRETGKKS